MNVIKRLFHRCRPPYSENDTVGDTWTCPDCSRGWLYSTRIIQVETRPAVWDQWAQTEDVPVTRWRRVEARS